MKLAPLGGHAFSPSKSPTQAQSAWMGHPSGTPVTTYRPADCRAQVVRYFFMQRTQGT